MARDSFNEQKNKNVYSTKKKKKKQTTKTVVKKPQSSSVSSQQRTVDPKEARRQESQAQAKSTVKKVQSTIQKAQQTAPARRTAGQNQKTYGNTEGVAQTINIPKRTEQQKAEDRARGQRVKSGIQTAEDERKIRERNEHRVEVAKNTGRAAVKGAKDTLTGYGKTMADVDEMAKSNEKWTEAKAMKLGVDRNDRKKMAEIEQERQESIKQSREFRMDLQRKQEERQAKFDEQTKDANELEKALYGAAESGTGMLIDTGIGAVTGTGQIGALASMGLRSYGTARGQAEKEGATESEDRLYSLASAGKEVATELMFQGAGLAKQAYSKGKIGLPLAEKAANALTKGLTGVKADAVGAGVKLLGGTAEENIEEFVGWGADPIIKELTYGRNVRNRMKESLRSNIPQIGSDEDAAQVASYFSTSKFTDDLTADYVKSGMSEEQASELAAEMRDYYVAYYSGDHERLEQLEEDLASKLSGQEKLSSKSWSKEELLDTFAATTLLTMSTGLPGAVKTSVKGNQAFDDPNSFLRQKFGDNAVRLVADEVKNSSDAQMSLRAETMKKRLDEGKDLTGTQKWDLMQGYQEKQKETAKKARASYGTVDKAMQEQKLVSTMGVDEQGNTVYAKNTQREFNKTYAENELTVEAVKNYLESDNSISDDEARRADAVNRAMTNLHVGGLTVGDAHEFGYGNTLAREALKISEGIDLDQYVVRNEDGTVNLPATNEATENALFQINADNAIKAAQAETEVFKDDYRGNIDRDIMSRLGNNGQAVWKDVNKDIDPRNIKEYLTAANASEYFYSAGRNTNMSVDDAVNRFGDTFKTVDNTVLKRAFAAGARDRIIANTPGYGQTVESGSNIQLKKTKPIITGQLIMDKDVVVPDTVQEAYLALAMATNANIHLVNDLSPTGKDGKPIIDKSTGQAVQLNGMSHGNDIYINVNEAAEKNLGYVFMHEMTHQIKQYAPNEYLVLENLVRDKWFNKDAAGMQKAIKNRIDLYAEKGGQKLTEEEAVEEIIADAMAEAMDDPNFAAEVCEENIELGNAILNSIKAALRSIRQMFASKEFKNERFHNSLLSYLGILDEAEKMWINALHTARQNKADGLIADWQEMANQQNSSRYKLIGRDADGIEIYETSPEILNMSWADRKAKAIDLMDNQFKGRTAKFIRDAVPYYAKFDKADVKKNLYGDRKSSDLGKDAKVNIAADGQMFELVEHAKQAGKPTKEKGKSTKAHRDVDSWEYFVKEVAIDGVYYNELINVRKLPDDEYVYEVNLWENAKKEGVVPTKALDIYKDKKRALTSEATMSSDNNIPSSSEESKLSVSDMPSMEEIDQTNTLIEDEIGEDVAQFQDDGSASFSISSYESEGRKIYKDYLDKLVNDKELSQEEADQMLRELETIYDISKRFADQTDENGDPVYAPYTAWSYADVIRDEKGKPVFSAIKKNSEYKMNIDFSTICKKRRTLDAVFREMIKRGLFEQLDLNKDESAALVVNINNLIRKNKFEAACALCFVEARRYRQQQTAKTFTNMWNGLVESMYKDKSKIGYFNFGRDDNAAEVPDGIHTMDDSQLDLSYITKIANEKKDGKLKQTAEAKAARLILNDSNQRKLMRVGDMMASTGFENMQIENPELMKVYNSKKGTGGAKSSFGDVQYLNEMIRSKTFDRMKAYDVSGVRIQSFSDYVPRMVFDYVQVIADLAAKKLPAHAYTKEPLFVKQFGLSGVKINLSLVPDVVADGIAPGLDANGDYIWNIEGTFPYDEAMKIQEAEGYKDNCGTIAVGISDEQIRKMLADPTIQMVIPYHKSSLNPIVAAMTNVDRFTNYEDFQNTKDAEGKAVKKDFLWDKKLFALTHYTRGENKGELKPKEKWGNVQDLVKEYVDWCEEKNYTPKFSQFLYMEDGSINPGYYKLLEDFALLDNDGNFKPQGDVQMRFPTTESKFGSMEELIKQGLSEDTELEANRSAKIGGIVDEIENMMTEGTLTEQSVASEKLAQRFSIVDDYTDNQGNHYDRIVLTDSQIFKGKNYRGREKALHDFVYNTLAGTGTYAYDDNGNRRFIEFARENERISKKGSDNSNRVLDKLAKKNKVVSQFAVAHATELIEVSKPDYGNEHNDNHTHQWLDENGWDFRRVYILTTDGKVLEALLNIGITKDGRKILYDINKINAIGDGEVPHNLGATKTSNGKYSISEDDDDGNLTIASRDDTVEYIMQNAEDITDIPLQDARLEENRIRYSLDATNFENSIVSEWDRRKRNLADDVKDTPLRRSLIRLMKQVRTDSGEDKQYSTETIDETIRSLKKMYYYAKGDKAKDFAREAWDAAERIVGDINYNDVQYLHYKGISNYFADTEIHVPEELIDDDTFIQFAKTNAGRIRLFADEGIEIEEAWKSLHDAYPDLFPRAAFVADSPVGMLIQMDWVLNQLEPYKEAYTSEEHSKLVEDIANTLCNIVEEGNEYNATVNDLNVRAMRQRHSEALRKVQEQEKQKRDNQKERAEKWKQKYLERLAKNKADKEAGKQKKNETKLVGDIEKNIKWLSDRLRPETRTKDNAIPEQFRSALGALLSEFDLQSKGSKKIEKKKGYPSKTTLKLKQLREQYAAIAKENDDDGNNVFRYNGDLLVKMDELIKTMESLDKFFDKRYGREVTIADLSLSEMFIIDTMLKSLVHEFREYKNVTINSKRAEIADVSSEVIGDMDTQIGRHGAAREGGALGRINGLLNMAEVTPIYFFKRLGAMYKMYRELRKGFDKYIENDREVINRLSEIMSGYYNKKNPGTTIESWRTTEDAQTFNFEHGPITLSVAQMMEVYLYANRPQAFGHMIGDGIIVTPISPVGKIETAKEKLMGHEPMVDPVRLTYENVQEIISKLSKEQVEMANKLQKLVAGYMSDLGNETTMKLYGYKMFDDPNYFGIHVSQTATNSNVDAPAITETIKNFGWTKPLTPGAKNTIVIGDIFTDVARYCNEMNQFNAYAVPVSDFMRVYNYKLRDEEGNLKGSAKSAIYKAFGKQADTYIMNFLRDLNGSSMRRNGGLEGMIDAALGRAKKAAVFMNMRVALQQPTAIVRALAQINARYFVGVRPSAAATKEMIEHCPIAQWKAWGFYDTHFGRDVEDLIMNNWSKADVVGSWIYGALDNMTWGMIWQAVKNEVDADIKKRGLNVKKGSQEYWDMCNDRASVVFDSTQVVDSPFHRSDAMRSKDTLVKQFTSFQAEPTLSFNVVRDFAVQAYDAVADGDKTKAAKLIAKGVEIWTLQAAVVAVAQSLWDAVRHKDPDGDDDEDEGFLELWWQNFMADFVDDLKFYNNIYFLKEFTPYAEKLVDYMKTGKWDTYDSNKLLMFQGAEKITQGLQQLIKKIQKGDEYKHKNGEPYTWYEVMTNFLGGVGYLTGMPIGTVMRDVQSIFKWFNIEVFASDEIMDAVANKMGYRPIGSKSESKGTSGNSGQYKDDLLVGIGLGKTAEEKEQAARDKKIKSIYDKYSDLSGEERDKKVWSAVTSYYKDDIEGGKSLSEMVEEGRYEDILQMKLMYQAAGGDRAYFEERVLAESKSALKKSIVYNQTQRQIDAQQRIIDYMTHNGMSEYEISEIAYHSVTARDLKVAFRINDKALMLESLQPLINAGLTYDDLVRLWDNRNRVDLVKYKKNGRYKDKLKSTGTFVWPTQGTITSHFGYRNAPTRGASSNHPAIDIGAPTGTPVMAADGGVVIYAGSNGGYGNSVGIKHDNGMVTYYNHLSGWNVKVGDSVSQGQQIAAVGSTGVSTGPHLDFKILDTDGKPVDPEMYLNKRS